jgi:hypothetical protein
MKPNYAIIYCIGTSDINVINNRNSNTIVLKAEKGTLREITKNFLAVLTDKQNDFTVSDDGKSILLDGKAIAELPIFSTTLNEIKSKYSLDNFNDIQYYFICTDQKDKFHNEKDTVYLAGIFRLYLEKLGVPANQVKIDVINSNPAMIDIVFNHFEGFLKQAKEIKDVLRAFVVSGPGTPAMNIAMINTFSMLNNVELLYTSREAGKTILKELNFNKIMWEEAVKRNVLSLIETYDYPAAETVYDTSLNPDTELHWLLKSLSYRVNFEFDKAEDCLRKVTNPSSILNNLSKYILKVREKNKAYILKELYYEFCIRMKSRRYLEAIGMVFRFEEEILKSIIEEIFKIEITKKDNFTSFKNKIESLSELKDFLSEKGIKYDEPSRYSYKGIIEFFVKNSTKLPIPNFSLKDIWSFTEGIDPDSSSSNNTLPQLRNHTPFGHGVEGVSEEKIREIYPDGPDVLVKEFRRVLAAIGIAVEAPADPDFSFNKINNYIAKKLKQ